MAASIHGCVYERPISFYFSSLFMRREVFTFDFSHFETRKLLSYRASVATLFIANISLTSTFVTFCLLQKSTSFTLRRHDAGTLLVFLVDRSYGLSGSACPIFVISTSRKNVSAPPLSSY